MQNIWRARWKDVLLLLRDNTARFFVLWLSWDTRGAGDRGATIPPISPIVVLLANVKLLSTGISFFTCHVLTDVKYNLRLTHHRVSLSVEVKDLSDGSWDVCLRSLALKFARDFNHGGISGHSNVWRGLMPAKHSFNHLITDLARFNRIFDLSYLIRTFRLRILLWFRRRYVIVSQV